jgi:hypothetical protein
MAAVSTFGATPASLTTYVHRLVINSTTSPNTDQTEELIDLHASFLCGLLSSMKIDPASVLDAPGTQQGWLMCTRYVELMAVYDIQRNRTANTTEQTRSYYSEAQDILRGIRKRPADLGDILPTGPGSPNLVDSHVTRSPQVRAAARDYSTLGNRLAFNRRGQL